MMALLEDWRLWAALGATFLAGVLRGYSGFGTAILLAPVYSVLWGPRVGVPVMLLLEFFVSMQLLPRAFREADRRLILPMGGAATLAVPLGAVVLLTADPEALRRFIGGFVIIFGLLLVSGWRYHGTRPLGLNLAVGAVSGVLKGATGMSGPPVILYLLAGPEAVARHRANLILYFGVISVVSILGPLWGGLLTAAVFWKLLLALPALLLGVQLGARLFHVVPLRFYKPFATGALLAAGAVALLA